MAAPFEIRLLLLEGDILKPGAFQPGESLPRAKPKGSPVDKGMRVRKILRSA
jgi:hypothetical protein